MNIVIVGAGQVGASLAAQLVVDKHNVTVIDLNREVLGDLELQYDLRTIQGHGASPQVLAEAGAASADMLIAVAQNDDTNIVTCLAAETVFKVPIKIARIRTPEYFLDSGEFFAKGRAPVDVFINPAELITRNIVNLIESPGALRIFDFARGKVRLIATKPLAGGALVGKKAAQLQEYLPFAAAKIVAIYRNDVNQPLEDTVIALGDDILFVAESGQVTAVLNALRSTGADHPPKRIMIMGGGHIGGLLAQLLENKYQIKLIEQDRQRCEQLAQQLRNTTVLHGNGCDSRLLQQEDIETIDCFCALSNSDADNIVSALHSKQMGAKQVIALVNRDAYLSLIFSGYIHIDIAISPQQITTSAILKHLHRGVVTQAYSLRRGAAEAIALIAAADAKAVGCTLTQLSLPQTVQIGAVLRGETVIAPSEKIIIEPQDTVIAYVADKAHIPALQRLFSDKGA